MEPKYPHVYVPLIGEDGNAFSILGRVCQALRLANVPEEEIEAFSAEAMRGGYDHLLNTVINTVNIFDEEEVDA